MYRYVAARVCYYELKWVLMLHIFTQICIFLRVCITQKLPSQLLINFRNHHMVVYWNSLKRERIDASSRSLSDTRINIQLRSATNLLDILEIGVIDKDTIANSASLTILLNGGHNAIALILESPDDLADRHRGSNNLLHALLSIVRETYPSLRDPLNISTKILEQLSSLKETGTNVETVIRIAIDEVRSHTTTFGMNVNSSIHPCICIFYFLTQTIGTLCGLNKFTGFTQTASVKLDFCTHNSSKFRGAGAILNSRLVLPDFVLTERDDRGLFDVQV